jgi:hypothetical protein
MVSKKKLQHLFELQSPWWLPAIAILCLVVWTRQINLGGLSWSDAPQHALDGAFILDAIRAMPSHISQWAQDYYLRYPNLGIVTFYPPFFAGVEAAFYALLGVTVLAARFCVVAFALAALLAMYWVVRQLFDRTTGLIAAALWATLPTTILWSRQVMLEVPTVAMILIALGCYLKYRSSNSILWLALTAVTTALAFFTKQWAGFFAIVLFIDLLITLGPKKTFALRHILAMGFVAVVIGAYMLLSSRYAALSGSLVRGENGWQHLLTVGNWIYYLKAMPDVLGWPMIAFMTLGLFIAVSSTNTIYNLRLPMLWAIVFYLFASVIAYKEPRYFYLFVPAAVILTAGGLIHGLEKTNLAWAGRALLLTMIGFQLIQGWFQNPSRLASFKPAAKLIVNKPDADLVLIDANREGDFIFALRGLQGPDGKIIPLRGSKLLYSRAARRRWGYQAYVENESQILKLIQNYGLRYIVVESSPPNVPDWEDYFPPPSQMLRNVLKDTTRFEKIAAYPISSDPIWQKVQIEVYRYRAPFGPLKKSITLPMPSVGKNIEIRLPNR